MKKMTQLLALVIIISALSFAKATAQAQIPKVDHSKIQKVDPNVRIKPNSELKKYNDKLNKILGSKLTEVSFNVWGERTSMDNMFSHFNNREVVLMGKGSNVLNQKLVNLKSQKQNNQTNWTAAYTGKQVLYSDFLRSGFDVKIDFTKRSARIGNAEFAANYSVGFLFSDGTKVVMPLQEMTIAGQKGIWKSTGEVHVAKSFEDTDFPDPAKPVKIQIIK